MEQRRLRLGDILDDYCPRERRLTNHAVVAMIEEDVRQTRCTTCDAEHVYKGGKVPRRRSKKDTPGALYKEVLAGMPESDGPPVLSTAHLAETAPAPVDELDDVEEPSPTLVTPAIVPAPARHAVRETPAELLRRTAAAPLEASNNEASDNDARDNDAPDVEDGPVHRPLIRAQLPRVEGHKEERRLPEFTIRQPGRGTGGFRGGAGGPRQPRPGGGQGGEGGNPGNGNRPHGGARFSGARPGGPGRNQPGRGGPAAGFRGAGQPRQGGPKKRSR